MCHFFPQSLASPWRRELRQSLWGNLGLGEGWDLPRASGSWSHLLSWSLKGGLKWQLCGLGTCQGGLARQLISMGGRALFLCHPSSLPLPPPGFLPYLLRPLGPD